MTVLTTLGLKQSIRQGWPLAMLVYIDHPDGEIRLWTGIGDLKWDGNTYEGIGRFGGIKNIGGAKELRVRQLTFELRGVPADATKHLNKDIRNRASQAWIAGMDKRGQHLNGEPWKVVDGKADYHEFPVEDDGTVTVQMMVTEPVWSIERAQNLAFTPEWINERFRDGGNRITGLDLISTLANRQESWTRT